MRLSSIYLCNSDFCEPPCAILVGLCRLFLASSPTFSHNLKLKHNNIKLTTLDLWLICLKNFQHLVLGKRAKIFVKDLPNILVCTDQSSAGVFH